MKIIKNLFLNKRNDSAKETSEELHIFESDHSKEYDREEDEYTTVQEILRKNERQNSVIVLEVISIEEKQQVGRRALLPLERPILVRKRFQNPGRNELRFYYADKSEAVIPSTRSLPQKKGRQNIPNAPPPGSDDPSVEREGVVSFHHQYDTVSKDIKLFITKETIQFKPLKEKGRLTQIPLVYIESVTKHEKEPTTFIVSTTGVRYYFRCKTEEVMNVWIKDMVYFIRYAQEKFVVQHAEIKMNESCAKKVNLVWSLADLSESDIFAKKKLRESLFQMLEKKQVETETRLDAMHNYTKIFQDEDWNALDDWLDKPMMVEILAEEGLQEMKLKTFASETYSTGVESFLEESRMGLKRRSTGLSHPNGHINGSMRPRSYYKKVYDRVRERLRKHFTMDEFLNYLFDQIAREQIFN